MIVLLKEKKETLFKGNQRHKTNIPVKIINSNADLGSPHVTRIFNESIENSIFPEKLTLTHISPLHKKDNRHEKENWRPVSVLETLPKVLERCLHNQTCDNIDNILTKYQTGFHKEI